MPQIATAGCHSCEQDYAMQTTFLEGAQSLRQKKCSISRLHLEVSPEVSDLGLSHRQIRGPHAG